MPRHTCAHCRTRLEEVEGVDDCPHCGRALRQGGALMRPLDVDFDQRLARLDEQTKQALIRGTIAATVISACSVVPLVAVISGIVMVAFQLVWARWKMAAPYARYFTGTRRIVSRWLSRLAVVTLLPLHGAHLIPIPGLAFLVSPLVFAGICAGVWAYFRFHLIREKEEIPVTGLERMLLVLAFAVVFILMGIAIGLAVVFGFALKGLGIGE